MEVRMPKLRSLSGALGLSQNRLILVLCLVIGVATGLGALAFKWLIGTFDYLFFEDTEFGFGQRAVTRRPGGNRFQVYSAFPISHFPPQSGYPAYFPVTTSTSMSRQTL